MTIKTIWSNVGIGLLVFSLITAVSGCEASASQSSSNKHATTTPKSPVISTVTKQSNSKQPAKGVQLKLQSVDDQFQPIFKKNFSIVENNFKNLIQDQGDLPSAITEPRPDLNNATLVYDASNNTADFVYHYTPKPEDLDTTSLDHMMWVKLAAYYYIAQAVDEYFMQCKDELEQQQIPFTTPNIAVKFKVSENNWLGVVRTSPYQLDLIVQLPHAVSPISVPASLATGTMVTAVSNPNELVAGNNSPEYSLLKFFHLKQNQIIQNRSADDPSHESVKPDTSLIYKNSQYGYTLNFPSDWKGHYQVVTGKPSTPDCLATISIDYVDQGKDYGTIFEINAYSDKTWASYNGEAPEQKIISKNGVTLTVMQTVQPSSELLQPNHSSQLHQMQKLWGEVPNFINQLKW